MTLRTRSLVAVLLLCAAPALARKGPNPPARLVLDPTLSAAGATPARAPSPWLPPGMTSTRHALPSSADGASQAQALVPLPNGAVQIDSTTYDLQDMGSLGTRIVVGADKRVHLTWQDDFCELGGGCPPNLNAPQPYPNRGMGYAVRSALGVWSNLGKVADPSLRNCCVTDLAGGFGTVSVNAAGRAAVAQHLNEDGCDLRGDFYLENAPNGSTWAGYLTPIVSPSYLFPQVVANPNGSYTICGEIPKGGSYDETQEFRTSYVAAAGGHFTCPTGWQMGTWTSVVSSSLFRDGMPAFPSLAVSSNGHVGIAVGDFGGNVILIESSNGSFAPATITIRKLTNYTDATIVKSDSTSTEYRAYIHCHLAYNDTTPNVVWSELQARKSGTTIAYFDWRSRIMHWDPIRGVEVVKRVTAGEADHYDDIDNGLNGPLAGFNTLSVDWPQVGFSADGLETYVAWLKFSDTQVDPTATEGLPGICTGTGFGDIALSLTRAGQPWSLPQNLTNTPQTDERYFSLAQRNPDGKAHLVFQASATNQAGTAVIGDRGSTPGNLTRRIAYLEAPISGTLVGVDDGPALAIAPRLTAWPNPSSGGVRFGIPGATGMPHDAVEVFSVSGRRVARLEAGQGGSFEWDGRDLAGHEVAAGVYFARFASDPTGSGTRFVRIR